MTTTKATVVKKNPWLSVVLFVKVTSNRLKFRQRIRRRSKKQQNLDGSTETPVSVSQKKLKKKKIGFLRVREMVVEDSSSSLPFLGLLV